MSSRGRIPPAYIQATGLKRHGPPPGLSPSAGQRPLEPHSRHDLVGNKVAVQAVEIEQLSRDNQRLAATHGDLRQELVAAQQEIQRVRAHMRSIQTESDIQVRILLDKIGKMEIEIRAGEGVKKELQQAHMDAQSLVTARQDLTGRIQQASQELQKTRAEVKKLPDMHAELDCLRQEHQRLRAAFEYEKGINVELVERLEAMEKNLMAMAREMEMLRGEVLNAETRVRVPMPYGGSYMNPNSSHPPPIQASGPYVDGYGRPLVPTGHVTAGEAMIAYGGSGAAPPPVAAASVVAGPGGGAGWEEHMNPLH